MINILSMLRSTWIIYAVFVLIIVGLYVRGNVYKTDSLRAQIAAQTCDSSMQLLKQQGDEEVEKLKEAEKKALKLGQEQAKKTQKLASSQIPEECNAAIHWGAQQAIALFSYP